MMDEVGLVFLVELLFEFLVRGQRSGAGTIAAEHPLFLLVTARQLANRLTHTRPAITREGERHFITVDHGARRIVERNRLATLRHISQDAAVNTFNNGEAPQVIAGTLDSIGVRGRAAHAA